MLEVWAYSVWERISGWRMNLFAVFFIVGGGALCFANIL
jgi:hypothetical protein